MKIDEDLLHLKTQSLASIASTDEEKAFIKPFVDLDNQAKLFETMEGNQAEEKKPKEQESVQEKAKKESEAEFKTDMAAAN